MSLLKRTDAPEILFHHRFPTSTDNVRNACHPFSTKNFFEHQYVMVHNGVVWNSRTLKNDHYDTRGIKYVSEQFDGRFNDSEALMYDIALYLEGEQEGLKAKGDIAFILIENDENGKAIKLHFGRNTGSPLMMDFQDDHLALSSEGNGVMIKPDTLYTYDYASQVLTLEPLVIPEYEYYYSSSSYTYQPIGYTPVKASKTLDELYADMEEDLPDNEQQYYYDKIATAGRRLGLNLLSDGHFYDAALQEVQGSLDSNDGKIRRIEEQINQQRYGSKKYNKLLKERDVLWYENDVLNEAIDFLGEMALDDFGSIYGYDKSLKEVGA